MGRKLSSEEVEGSCLDWGGSFRDMNPKSDYEGMKATYEENKELLSDEVDEILDTRLGELLEEAKGEEEEWLGLVFDRIEVLECIVNEEGTIEQTLGEITSEIEALKDDDGATEEGAKLIGEALILAKFIKKLLGQKEAVDRMAGIEDLGGHIAWGRIALEVIEGKGGRGGRGGIEGTALEWLVAISGALEGTKKRVDDLIAEQES